MLDIIRFHKDLRFGVYPNSALCSVSASSRSYGVTGFILCNARNVQDMSQSFSLCMQLHRHRIFRE